MQTYIPCTHTYIHTRNTTSQICTRWACPCLRHSSGGSCHPSFSYQIFRIDTKHVCIESPSTLQKPSAQKGLIEHTI